MQPSAPFLAHANAAVRLFDICPRRGRDPQYGESRFLPLAHAHWRTIGAPMKRNTEGWFRLAGQPVGRARFHLWRPTALCRLHFLSFGLVSFPKVSIPIDSELKNLTAYMQRLSGHDIIGQIMPLKGFTPEITNSEIGKLIGREIIKLENGESEVSFEMTGNKYAGHFAWRGFAIMLDHAVPPRRNLLDGGKISVCTG